MSASTQAAAAAAAAAGSQPSSAASRTRAKSIGHYILGKTIGEGTFGKVKLGTHILTGERVAVKVLEKERIVEVADVERAAREVHILKLIRHPYIVQLYEIIETRRQLYLIMEYASGGELFDYIVASQRVMEPEAARFFHQIIAGVEKIHQMHIAHRDLKPENLLLDEYKNIKIVDFGLSNTFREGQLLKTACGSPCYAAPEMIAGHQYVPNGCDLWSCGVILFALVGGYLPFEDQNTAALYKKILAADYKAPKFITDACRDLIAGLLTTDPVRRFNIPMVRQHNWYRQVSESTTLREMHLKAEILPGQSNLEDDVLRELDAFGFPRDYAVRCLELNKHNHVTTTYYLLAEKKRRMVERIERMNDLHFRHQEFDMRDDDGRMEDLSPMNSTTPGGMTPPAAENAHFPDARVDSRGYYDQDREEVHMYAASAPASARTAGRCRTPPGGASGHERARADPMDHGSPRAHAPSYPDSARGGYPSQDYRRPAGPASPFSGHPAPPSPAPASARGPGASGTDSARGAVRRPPVSGSSSIGSARGPGDAPYSARGTSDTTPGSSIRERLYPEVSQGSHGHRTGPEPRTSAGSARDPGSRVGASAGSARDPYSARPRVASATAEGRSVIGARTPISASTRPVATPRDTTPTDANARRRVEYGGATRTTPAASPASGVGRIPQPDSVAPQSARARLTGDSNSGTPRQAAPLAALSARGERPGIPDRSRPLTPGSARPGVSAPSATRPSAVPTTARTPLSTPAGGGGGGSASSVGARRPMTWDSARVGARPQPPILSARR